MTYSLILALLTLFFMGKTFEKMGPGRQYKTVQPAKMSATD